MEARPRRNPIQPSFDPASLHTRSPYRQSDTRPSTPSSFLSSNTRSAFTKNDRSKLQELECTRTTNIDKINSKIRSIISALEKESEEQSGYNQPERGMRRIPREDQSQSRQQLRINVNQESSHTFQEGTKNRERYYEEYSATREQPRLSVNGTAQAYRKDEKQNHRMDSYARYEQRQCSRNQRYEPRQKLNICRQGPQIYRQQSHIYRQKPQIHRQEQPEDRVPKIRWKLPNCKLRIKTEYTPERSPLKDLNRTRQFNEQYARDASIYESKLESIRRKYSRPLKTAMPEVGQYDRTGLRERAERMKEREGQSNQSSMVYRLDRRITFAQDRIVNGDKNEEEPTQQCKWKEPTQQCKWKEPTQQCKWKERPKQQYMFEKQPTKEHRWDRKDEKWDYKREDKWERKWGNKGQDELDRTDDRKQEQRQPQSPRNDLNALACTTTTEAILAQCGSEGREAVAALVGALSEQIALDKSFRNGKKWFQRTDSVYKWVELSGILENKHVRLDQASIKQIFTTKSDQDDPFYTFRPTDCSVEELADQFIRCEHNWFTNVVGKYDKDQLLKGGFREDLVDLGRRGYIELEDVTRFMNSALDGSCRNRDVFLICQRLKAGEQLLFDHILTAVCK